MPTPRTVKYNSVVRGYASVVREGDLLVQAVYDMPGEKYPQKQPHLNTVVLPKTVIIFVYRR